MAFESPKIAFIACGILVIVSILYITANALPIWVTRSVDSQKRTLGLWRVCDKNEDISECVNLPLTMDDTTMATRAFITICCILAPLSFISILSIILVNENLKKHMSLLAKVLAIASAISGIIGVGLGISIVVDATTLAAAMEVENVKMGASCILAIVAVTLNLVGAIITFMIK
ncbi:unnamed protein product [Adineta steineri]|uniref:Uncharacterized protein n=1 Tax=Adineta steineri TaxID=433720 RepID=A0A815PZF1_9BILA|nr:unnamed protein product [Adineta steineri]CAF1455799.1 unnamed protein product [Adineta steineri]